MPVYDAIITGTTNDDTLNRGLLPATNRLWFKALDGNDTILSENTLNRIDAGNGNDHITSTGGTIYAGTGNDDINVTGSGTATIYDGAGSDHVFVSMAKGVRATVYADTTDSSADDWYIVNNTGTNVRLSYANAGVSGPLMIDARKGIATDLSIGTDHFSGFTEIVGGVYDTTIYANDAGMTIWTSGGYTRAYGGSGDDSFIYGKGSGPTFISDNTGGVIDIRPLALSRGGNGSQVVAIVSTTAGGKIDLRGCSGGSANITLDDSITGVSNKITIIAGGSYFNLKGNDSYETVYVGNASSTTIEIGKNGIIAFGIDSERLNAGFDVFKSSAVNSVNETVSYASTTQGITVYGGQIGFQSVSGKEVGIDSAMGFERIIGGSGNDFFLSNGDAYNAFFGGAGDDQFASNLATNVGRMDVKGGSGNDICTGGRGFDVIELGDGSNTATGGAGRDFFDFLTDVKAIAGQTHTTITDFENGIDKIRLGGDLTKEYFLDHLTQVGTTITFTNTSGDTLILNNTQIAQLDVTDFILM
jgi:hypothetical protein